MWKRLHLTAAVLLPLGCAVMAMAGDLVVDGKIVSQGTGFQFPDGSIQASASYPKWERVAVVDLSGRGDYTDPVAAMTNLGSWCPTPSATTPCLVKILPGTYSLGTGSLTMQPYVEIEGSGRESTVITTSTATAVTAANHSALRSLTIVNETSLSFVVGVSIQNSEFRLSDVRVEVMNPDAASSNYGVSASDSTLLAESIDISVQGGFFAYGVETDNSCFGLIRHATVHAGTPVSGASRAEGISLAGITAPAIVESEVSIETADIAQGIGVYGPDLYARDVRINVRTDSHGEGFSNSGSGTVELNGGTIQVEADGIGEALGAYGGLLIVREAALYGKSTGEWGYGASSNNSAQLVLERVTITAEGGTLAFGVHVYIDGVATLTDVIVRTFGASSYNYGIYSESSVPFTAERCTVMASGGTGSWGVLNSGGSGGAAGGTIDHSTISGGNAAVRNDNASADVSVGNSKLGGGVSANLTCFGNYDENYVAVTCP